MRRIVIGLALAATSVFLVGCGASEDSVGTGPNSVDPKPRPNLEQTTGRLVRDGDTDLIVRKFTIDGTTCVMVAYEGGISCDWSAE